MKGLQMARGGFFPPPAVPQHIKHIKHVADRLDYDKCCGQFMGNGNMVKHAVHLFSIVIVLKQLSETCQNGNIPSDWLKVHRIAFVSGSLK